MPFGDYPTTGWRFYALLAIVAAIGLFGVFLLTTHIT